MYTFNYSITWKKSPFTTGYKINDYFIKQINIVKYLGVTITDKLSWSKNISSISNIANSIRAFLQRSLSQCQLLVKSTCYATCIRPIIEYACLRYQQT